MDKQPKLFIIDLAVSSKIVSILPFPPSSKKTEDKTENHDKDNDVT